MAFNEPLRQNRSLLSLFARESNCLWALSCLDRPRRKLPGTIYPPDRGSLKKASLQILSKQGLWTFWPQREAYLRYLQLEWLHPLFSRTKGYPIDLTKQLTTFKLRRFHSLDKILKNILVEIVLRNFIKFSGSFKRSIAVKYTIGCFLLSSDTVHLISVPFYVV